MKQILSLVLALVLVCPAVSLAGPVTDDYSWLDDLTINQLKALDEEIHKRIPREQAVAPVAPDASALFGQWVYEVRQDFSSSSHASWYGHHVIRTYEFYTNGIGKSVSYDATAGKSLSAYSVEYEMKDEQTVVITFDALGTQKILLTIYEDGEGSHMRRADNGWVYTKGD